MKSLKELLNESILVNEVVDSKVVKKSTDLIISELKSGRFDSALGELQRLLKQGINNSQTYLLVNNIVVALCIKAEVRDKSELMRDPDICNFILQMEKMLVQYGPEFDDDLLNSVVGNNTNKNTKEVQEIDIVELIGNIIKDGDFDSLADEYGWTPDMIEPLKDCLYLSGQGGYSGGGECEWHFEYEGEEDDTMEDFFADGRLGTSELKQLKKNSYLKSHFKSDLNKVKVAYAYTESGADTPALLMFKKDYPGLKKYDNAICAFN